MRKLWQGSVIIFILLIGIFDIYFRDLSLLEIGKWVGIGFLLGLIGTGVIFVLFIAFALSKREKLRLIRKPRTYDDPLGEIAVGVLLEELIFRGPLFVILLIWELPTMVWVLLIIIDGVLFGLAHSKKIIFVFNFIGLSWIGIILSGLVIKSGSLISPISLHLIWLMFLQIFYRFVPATLTTKTKHISNPEN